MITEHRSNITPLIAPSESKYYVIVHIFMLTILICFIILELVSVYNYPLFFKKFVFNIIRRRKYLLQPLLPKRKGHPHNHILSNPLPQCQPFSDTIQYKLNKIQLKQSKKLNSVVACENINNFKINMNYMFFLNYVQDILYAF